MFWILLCCLLVKPQPDPAQESKAQQPAPLGQLQGARPVSEEQFLRYQQEQSLKHERELLDLEKKIQVLEKQDMDLDTGFARLDMIIDVYERIWYGLIPLIIGLISWPIWYVRKVLVDKFAADIRLINQVLADAKLDQRILTSERLLVISRNSGTVKKVLADLKFRLVDHETVPEGPLTDSVLHHLPIDDHDLVIFDQMDADWIKAYLKASNDEISNKVFFAYTPGQLDLRDPRVSFANSQISLYSRIMEAARYRRQVMT